ncbi:MAG: HypC/HybG/HupF family hydrogenase formation chaperone [Eggerthellaceae bacterium]|nr:HypC/HybG/HupF family hydrogenase formation chaperone [Eggerthellaceae bacterium]
MCLAIPAMVTEIDDDRMANVDILGAQRSASLDLVPQAQVGDYVLVHAGFAIEVVDPQFAKETLDLIAEFPELVDLDNPAGSEVASQGGHRSPFAVLAADVASASDMPR